MTHRRFVDHLDTSMREAYENFSETSVVPLGNGHCINRVLRPLAGKVTALWSPMMPADLRPVIERRRAEVHERVGEARAREICDYYTVLQIFPNLLVMESQAVSIRQFFPTSPGGLDVTIWSLLPSELEAPARDFALKAFTLFWGPAGFGSADDVDILESCQSAFANREAEWSDISRGMLNDRPAKFDDELPAREFWKQWQQSIDPETAQDRSHDSSLLPFKRRGA
jgi:hypothetical protein